MSNIHEHLYQDYEEYRKINHTRWFWRGYEIRVRKFGTKVGRGFNIFRDGEFIVLVTSPLYTDATDVMRYIDYHLDRGWPVAQAPQGRASIVN